MTSGTPRLRERESMSNQVSEKAKTGSAPEVQIKDFIAAKIDGQFKRFKDAESVPDGATDLITPAILNEMTKEQVSQLYGHVAGTNPKNFKSKTVAIDSIAYQAGKLPIYDPTPKPTAATPAPEGKKAPAATLSTGTAEGKEKYERRAPNKYELLSPENVAKILTGLAPQARELVTIMTELATDTDSPTFTEADLLAKLALPDVAARLRTRQDPSRILQYYKAKLVSTGLVRVS